MALVCAGAQLTLSILLLKSFDITNQQSSYYEVGSEIHVVRMMACFIFHFAFAGEAKNALELMKYAILHSERFERPKTAFFLCITQFTVTLLIEVVNIFNLAMQTKVLDVIMNFLALGVLADFDDFFLIPFLNARTKLFLEMTIPKKVYRSTTYVIPQRFNIPSSAWAEKESEIKKYVKMLRTRKMRAPKLKVPLMTQAEVMSSSTDDDNFGGEQPNPLESLQSVVLMPNIKSEVEMVNTARADQVLPEIQSRRASVLESQRQLNYSVATSNKKEKVVTLQWKSHTTQQQMIQVMQQLNLLELTIGFQKKLLEQMGWRQILRDSRVWLLKIYDALQLLCKSVYESALPYVIILMPFIYFMYLDNPIVVNWNEADTIMTQYETCLQTANTNATVTACNKVLEDYFMSVDPSFMPTDIYDSADYKQYEYFNSAD